MQERQAVGKNGRTEKRLKAKLTCFPRLPGGMAFSALEAHLKGECEVESSSEGSRVPNGPSQGVDERGASALFLCSRNLRCPHRRETT